MTLRRHAEMVARELGVTIYHEFPSNDFDFQMTGRAGPVQRYRSGIRTGAGELYLASWDNGEAETYWVAMHELGHYVDLEVQGNDRGERNLHDPSFAAAEARAWAWAIDNASPDAFPLGQVGESNIAWSLTDYMKSGWAPAPAYERIYRAIGPEPDWFHDVTTEAHYAKLEAWARPMWAELREEYGNG